MWYHTLLCRHKCFTGKYSIHKVLAKLHLRPKWHIFHIFTSGDIDDVFWYHVWLFNCTQICCCVTATSSDLPQKSSAIFGCFQKSSVIFRNFQRIFMNICLAFGRLLKNLWKVLEIFGKPSKTLLLVCLCNKQKIHGCL